MGLAERWGQDDGCTEANLAGGDEGRGRQEDLGQKNDQFWDGTSATGVEILGFLTK